MSVWSSIFQHICKRIEITESDVMSSEKNNNINLISARVTISAVGEVEVEVEVEGNDSEDRLVFDKWCDEDLCRFITKISEVKVDWHISQKALQGSPSTLFSHGSETCVQLGLWIFFGGILQGD